TQGALSRPVGCGGKAASRQNESLAANTAVITPTTFHPPSPGSATRRQPQAPPWVMSSASTLNRNAVPPTLEARARAQKIRGSSAHFHVPRPPPSSSPS